MTPKFQSKATFSKTHRVNCPNAKTKNSKGLKRRKNSVTQEDSHKEISGFVQGNPADHEERLIHSTLTQWKAAPGRDRRGHERKCSLQSHSRSWEGKGPSQAPSTSGNITGTGAGTWELIHLRLCFN